MTRRLKNRSMKADFRTPAVLHATVVFAMLTAGADQARAGLIIEDWEAFAIVTGAHASCSLEQPCPVAQVSVAGTGWGASAFQFAGGWDGAAAHANASAGWDTQIGATATFMIAVLNTGPDPFPLSFQFLINAGSLEMNIANFGALGDEIAKVQISSEVWTSTRTEWHYAASIGGSNSRAFLGLKEELADPRGIGKPAVTLDRPVPGFLRVDLSPFAGTLDLGDLPVGGRLELFYQIQANIETGIPLCFPDCPTDQFAPWVDLLANIEDPFSLNSGFYLNGQSLASLTATSAVPEPSTWLLLGLGMAWIAVRARHSARSRRFGIVIASSSFSRS
jgi:hypothetical protein